MIGRDDKLWFDGFWVEENTIWFFSNEFNGLFEFDQDTQELIFLGIVPGEEVTGEGLFMNLIKVENKIVLVPAHARQIAVFDLVEKKFITILITLNGFKFMGATSYNNKIFMLGYDSPIVVSLDLNTLAVIYHKDCLDVMKNRKINNNINFRRNSTVVDSCYYFAFCNTNLIGCIDMEKEKFSFYEIGDSSLAFRNIAYDGEYFWISVWGELSLIKWNMVTKETKIYRCDELKGKKYNTSEIIVNEDKIFVFPTTDDSVMIYNKKNNIWNNCYKLNEYRGYEGNKLNPWGHQAFPTIKEDNDLMYIFASNIRKMLVYDKKNVLKVYEFVFNKLLQEQFEFAKYKMNNDNYEKSKADLRMFIKDILTVERRESR